MAETTKMTRKDLFNWIITLLDSVEFDTDEEREIAGEAKEMCFKNVERLSRKPKPRVNKEAIAFAENVRETLESGEPGHVWTAKEVAEAMGVSSHKAAAGLRRLTGEGIVEVCEKAHKNDANSYVLAGTETEGE